jgi:hypothetical protein
MVKIIVECPEEESEENLKKMGEILKSFAIVKWVILLIGKPYKVEIEKGNGFYIRKKDMVGTTLLCIAEKIK